MNLKKLLHYFKKPQKVYRDDLYRGEKVALLTMHAKEEVIAPILYGAIGCEIERVDGYDTDQLGSFSREIPRVQTQLETARKKALLGMELSGLDIGIASEGSFGVDPLTGIFSTNVECLLWIDKKNDLEISLFAHSKTNLAHATLKSWQECESFALKAGFPQHHLIVRAHKEEMLTFYKGISSWEKLEEAFHKTLQISEDGSLFVETDMRANANPTRMQSIEKATQELAKKIASTCPMCGAPGFWIVEYLGGLECKICHNPTQEIYADLYGCSKCDYKQTVKRKETPYANPAYCDFCNP